MPIVAYSLHVEVGVGFPALDCALHVSTAEEHQEIFLVTCQRIPAYLLVEQPFEEEHLIARKLPFVLFCFV